MKGPLPEGYRFWIYPHYRLETPTVCTEFSPKVGELLTYLILNQERRVSHNELWEYLYDVDSPTGGNIVPTMITILRQKLRAIGVDINVDSKRGRPGWRFMGFGVCEPEVGLSVLYRRSVPRPKARKRVKVKQPKVFYPMRARAVYCEDVPWTWPERINSNGRYRLEFPDVCPNGGSDGDAP